MMNAALKISEVVDYQATEEKGIIEAINRSQAVIEFNLDGTIIKANDNFLTTLGYGLHEIEGKHHQIFCEESYRQSQDYRDFWARLNQGEFQCGEYKRVDKNGNAIWIIASYNPIFNDEGKPYKVVKFATDITASKIELEVRAKIMNMTNLVTETNLKGEIISASQNYLEVSKYGPTELIGESFNMLKHPDTAVAVFDEIWSTVNRGDVFRKTIKNQTKEGKPFYVDTVFAPIPGRNGKPLKHLGVAYDVTETELERQSMRGVLEAINGSFAYIEFDIKGNVLSFNQIFENTMHYSMGEVVGKHHQMFCEKAMVESKEYSQFWKDLNDGQRQSGVFKRLNKEGKEVWLQAVYAPVMDDVGRVVKIIKIATDVTSQQKITAIQELAAALSSASSELTATATQMSVTAEKTSKDSMIASACAEEVFVGVQAVATNVEEMVASIKEIGRNTNESSQMSKMTMEKAHKSNETIMKLGASSKEVGDVIKVISSIAQQTNLLALNATIEAARAGEAGKGFAVVANEVKELAKQTAKATEDITYKIEAIQADTQSAVQDIQDISQAVEKLNSVSGVIAAAVEEQGATTSEISRVVAESKKGVEEITATVKHVSEAANESSASSSQTLGASQELAKMAEMLAALAK